MSDLVARLPQTRAAVAYAERQHAGQRRSADGAPFIEHPLEVATLLYHAGASDQVIAAGVLHDTIEKTSTNATDLRARFGSANRDARPRRQRGPADHPLSRAQGRTPRAGRHRQPRRADDLRS